MSEDIKALEEKLKQLKKKKKDKKHIEKVKAEIKELENEGKVTGKKVVNFLRKMADNMDKEEL